MIVPALLHLPHPLIVVVKTAVKVIAIVVFVQFIGNAIDLHRRSADPVGIPSHRSAYGIASRLIAGDIVKSQHHIHRVPALSFHADTDQRCAVITHCCHCPRVISHLVQPDVLFVLRRPESCHFQLFHILSPHLVFIFLKHFSPLLPAVCRPAAHLPDISVSFQASPSPCRAGRFSHGAPGGRTAFLHSAPLS